MTDTLTDPRAELAELEERILEGDATVTPAALAKARQAADLAQLHEDAARRTAEREAAQDLEERRQAVRDEFFVPLAGALTEAQTAYRALIESNRSFQATLDVYDAARLAALKASNGLGIKDEIEMYRTSQAPVWREDAVNEAVGRPRVALRSGGLRRPIRGLLQSDEHFASLLEWFDQRNDELRRRRTERQVEPAERTPATSSEGRVSAPRGNWSPVLGGPGPVL